MSGEQSNKEMIIELRGEIKLIHQKIDTLTNNNKEKTNGNRIHMDISKF